MTWRVYRWDDTDAPQLNAMTGSLISLLDAVLVNGYTGKPAAGWTKSYNGTNSEGYANAGSAKSLRVLHNTNTNTPTVYAVESVTGGGVETKRFPTVAQVANPSWCISNSSDATNRPWLIAADNKRFVIWIGFNNTTAQGLTSTAHQMTYFAGDIKPNRGDDNYHFLVVLNQTAGSFGNMFGNIVASRNSNVYGHFMPRSHTQSGTSITVGKMADYGVSSASYLGTDGPTYPDPVSSGMLLSPVLVNEDVAGVVRGTLPGIWCPLHNLPGNCGDTFSGVGELAGKTFILLDSTAGGTRCRFALETSDTLGA